MVHTSNVGDKLVSSGDWSLLDHLPVGACVTKPDFTVVKWNRVLTRATQLNPAGKNLLEVAPNFNRKGTLARLKIVIETGAPAVFSSQLHGNLFPGAHEIVQEVSVERLSSNNYLIFSVVDVTDLTKRLEKAKDTAKQLERQRLELERSNNELSSFANIVSHDLKAPLRSIRNLSAWSIEDYSKDPNDITLPENLNKIHEQAQRMDRLLDDILNYAKLNTEDSHREEFEVHELISEISCLLSPPDNLKINQAGVPVVISTPKEPFSLVLRNIIDNAIKHHHKELGNVEIKTKLSDNNLIVSVADDGPGIDPRHHEMVFELFQTLGDRSSTSSSGVGLAMVKKIIEQHGGSIRLTSQVGEGSSFEVSWPCQKIGQ